VPQSIEIAFSQPSEIRIQSGALTGRLSCGHSKTGQTNRLEIEPIRQRSQHPFPKSPRLHSRYVRSDFRNGRSLRPSSSNLMRSAERDSDGFLKFESLDFFETPSPTHSLRKNAAAKAGVEIR
jgi:hypothetical protein